MDQRDYQAWQAQRVEMALALDELVDLASVMVEALAKAKATLAASEMGPSPALGRILAAARIGARRMADVLE